MSVIIDRPPITAAGASDPQLRLSLTPADAGPGLPDGAWWPHSRDLARELRALVEALDRCWGRITCITVNPAFWPLIPRKIAVTGHVVHVGRFGTEQDPHNPLLLSCTAGRRDLLVIPPQCSEAAAARLMAAATGPEGHHLTAGALVAAEEGPGAGQTDCDREAAWESEGGAVPSGFGDPSARPADGVEDP